VGSQAVIYPVNGVNTSFSEIMGLPAHHLDTTYWLPWYNNVDMDTQLRIANVSASTATVRVYIHGLQMIGSPFTMLAGESIRKSFAGVNNGPVKIESNVNIVASERIIYKYKGVNASFSEMMALPNRQLDTTYLLPWYNSVDLDTQLRIANVSSQPATVRIFAGGLEMTGSPFSLAAGGSTRKSFPGVNNGPVEIVSTQNIVVAERVIYKAGGANTSFSEMMGLPANQLHTTYVLPWYNNRDLDTQLRIANVGTSTATVRVYIGGVEMVGSPFTLAAGASTRKGFPGINNGPVKIVSTQDIVVAERVIYRVSGINTSFSEMMGLPLDVLDTTYYLPWYNNIDLTSQLRFGVP
jgi:membrane protein YqaA with SNARE-associated domain